MYSPLKNIFILKPSKNLKYLNDKNKFSIGLLQSTGINNTKNRKYDIKKNPRNFKFLMIFILGEKERKKNIEKNRKNNSKNSGTCTHCSKNWKN